MKRNFLQLYNHKKSELQGIIDEALQMKKERNTGGATFPLKGKSLGLIFQHQSTRTRVAFEVGMTHLGGQAIFLSAHDSQIQRGESMADTARVLSRYVDGIAARLDSQDDLEELAKYSRVPVINALTQEHHPCQILADLLTLKEHFKSFEKLRIVYLGDSNNVSNSWIEAANIFGFQLTLSCPKEYQPDFGKILGKKIPSHISWNPDPHLAVAKAHVLTTDVWVSMGTPNSEAKKKTLQPFQINSALLKAADPNAVVLHCLPAHREEEITAEVLEGKQSLVFDQAENNLHVQKSVLKRYLN